MALENTKSTFDAARNTVSGKVEAGKGQYQQSGVGKAIGGIKSLAKSGAYKKLHDDLTKVISQVRITTSGLDNQTVTALEEMYSDRYTEALTAGSEGDQKLASDQLDALMDIKKLMEGQGDSLAERVLDRETLTNEEAAKTLDYLRQITARAHMLEKDIKVSTSGAFDAFMTSISDERLSGTYRADVAKSVTDALAGSELFKGGAAAAELIDITSTVTDLSKDDTADRTTAALEKMRDKLDTAEIVNELANAAATQDMGQEELTETLNNLLKTMRRIDGFTEEQTHLSALMQEDLHGDQERMDKLRMVLTKVADRTVEAKTLFTLDQLNDKFDSAVLDQQEFEEALEKGNLGKEFMENAGKISSGGGAAAELLPALLTLINPGGMGFELAALSQYLPDFDLSDTAVGGVLGWKALKATVNKFRGGDKAPKATKAPGTANTKQTVDTAKNSIKQLTTHLRKLGPVGKIAAGILGGGVLLGGVSLFGDDDEGESVTAEGVPGDVEPPDSGLGLGLGGALGIAGGGAFVVNRAMKRKMPPMGATAQPEEPKPKPRIRVQPGGSVPTPEATKAAPSVRAQPGSVPTPEAPKVAPSVKPTVPKKELAKTLLKRAPGPLAALATLGFGVQDYRAAESDAERKEVAWSASSIAAGTAAGAALGSFIPGPGTLVGGIIGGIAGGFMGDWVGSSIASTLTNPIDTIPDEIRKSALDEAAYINVLLEDPNLSDDQREQLLNRKQQIKDGIGSTVDIIGEKYASLGVPQTMYMEHLKADLAQIPGVAMMIPEVYSELINVAGARWSGGAVTGPTPAKRSSRKSRRQARAASVPVTIPGQETTPGITTIPGQETTPGITTIPVESDALVTAQPMDIFAAEPDLAQPAKRSSRKSRRQARAASVPATVGVVSAAAEPMSGAMEGQVAMSGMTAIPMTQTDVLSVTAQPMDIFAAEPDLAQPAIPIENDTERMMSLAPPAAHHIPQPDQSRAVKPRKTRGPSRKSRKPGAPAPSASDDDFSIALVNDILFS